MKSPLASAFLLAGAVALFISGAIVAHTADSPKSHPVAAFESLVARFVSGSVSARAESSSASSSASEAD
jgi:hypothetical protein